MRTAIKQDLSQDLNLLDYAIWGVLENNTTFYPNISSSKTAAEEEWNKISEEFILKARKSFRRRVTTITEEKNASQKWLRNIYYDTRIFLILLPHPVMETIIF